MINQQYVCRYFLPPVKLYEILDGGSYFFTNMISIEPSPQWMRHCSPGATGQDKDAPRVDVFGLGVGRDGTRGFLK